MSALVDPVLFALRAFEVDWLEPLEQQLAQAEVADGSRRLLRALVAEAHRWIALGAAVGYFPASTPSAPDAELADLEWVLASPASDAPTPPLDAPAFARMLAQAQDDLTSQRRELLRLTCFAGEEEWSVRIHDVRLLGEGLGDEMPPPALVERAGWSLQDLPWEETDEPATRGLPADWRMDAFPVVVARSATASRRLAELTAARAVIERELMAWLSREDEQAVVEAAEAAESAEVSLTARRAREAPSIPSEPGGELDAGTETARSGLAVKPRSGRSGGELGRDFLGPPSSGRLGDFMGEAGAGDRPGGPVEQAERLTDRRPASPDPPPTPLPARLVAIAALTAVEALSIYVWLRLHIDGHPWWGLPVLLVGEMLETALLLRVVDRGGVRRWGVLSEGARANSHLRRMQRTIGMAGNAETAIWVLWLAVAYSLDQPIAGAIGLLVAMHVKHRSETAVVLDVPFRTGLFSFKSVVASAMEVAGAVACLALILDGQYVLAAVAIGAGLLVEHAMLIDVLQWEITVRDIRLPRDTRWMAPLRPRPVLSYAASHYARFWRLVQRIAPLNRWLNRRAISSRIARLPARPDPLSAMAPTDRSYSARHLLPAVPKPDQGLPTSAAVANLFERDGEMVECPKSTVLFSFFAQWFTDGTRRDSANAVRDTTRSTSSDDIDLAQLYGFDRDATDALRAKHGGLLKSQVINGEEYPPYYCSVDGPSGTPEPKDEFKGKLRHPLRFDKLSRDQQMTLFAMGTDTRNIGFISFNVLFLREHNRIARRLSDEHPSWDDDRLFETTRNILIVVLLKIVIDEYINHINPNCFRFSLIAGSFPNEPWHRPNWTAVEFNLLYRWHSLVPSTFHLSGKALAVSDLLSDTSVLTSAGLGQLMAAASSQPAGSIRLFNTDSFLVREAERPTIEQGRAAALASYNDYRRLCRFPPAASFAEVSSDPWIQQGLADLYYGGVEDVEFFVGLFAEDHGPDEVLPPLMSTMVSFDVFSRVLTNPLLAPRVFSEGTFSAVGMEIIDSTNTISDVLNRNVPRRSDGYLVSLTRRDYKRA